jgi:transcriptional regulator with XRE-family HTH domain
LSAFTYIISIFARKEYMWKEMSDPAIIEELGRRLKDLRMRKGLQQSELASLAGVSLFTISKIENGKAVSITMLIAVFRALNILENIGLLVPDKLQSPVMLRKLKGKTKYRIRKKNTNNE